MLPRRGKKIFFGGNGRVCDICSREALSGGCSAAPWTTASEAAGSVSASAASRASTASTQGDGSPPETVHGSAARRPAPARQTTRRRPAPARRSTTPAPARRRKPCTAGAAARRCTPWARLSRSCRVRSWMQHRRCCSYRHAHHHASDAAPRDASISVAHATACRYCGACAHPLRSRRARLFASFEKFFMDFIHLKFSKLIPDLSRTRVL